MKKSLFALLSAAAITLSAQAQTPATPAVPAAPAAKTTATEAKTPAKPAALKKAEAPQVSAQDLPGKETRAKKVVKKKPAPAPTAKAAAPAVPATPPSAAVAATPAVPAIPAGTAQK